MERYRGTPESDPLHKLADASMASTVEAGINTPLSVLQHAIEQLNKESLRLELQKESEQLSRPPSQLSDAQIDEVRKRLGKIKKP